MPLRCERSAPIPDPPTTVSHLARALQRLLHDLHASVGRGRWDMSDVSWGGVTQPSAGDREAPPAHWLPRAQLQRLLDALLARGYRVLGPVVRDAALHFDELKSIDGAAGRLARRAGTGPLPARADRRPHVFGVVNGPGGIKRHVFAPREPLLQIEMDGPGQGFRARADLPEPPRSRAARRARLRPRRPRGAGPHLPARPLSRSALRRAPRGIAAGRGRLHARGRHLLLRVDGTPDPAPTRPTTTSR